MNVPDSRMLKALSRRSFLTLLRFDSPRVHVWANLATNLGTGLGAVGLCFAILDFFDERPKLVLPHPDFATVLAAFQAEQGTSFDDSLLAAFIAIIEGKEIPREEWPATLKKLAASYKATERNLAAARDPEIAELHDKAKDRLEIGQFEAAEDLINQAIDLAISKAKTLKEERESYLSAAASDAATNGDLAATQLEHERAADYLRRAVSLLPEAEVEKKIDLLNRLSRAERNAFNFEAALATATQALELAEQHLGPQHPAVVRSLRAASAASFEAGNFAAAGGFLDHAMSVIMHSEDRNGFEVAEIFEQYAEIGRLLDLPSEETCRAAAIETLEGMLGPGCQLDKVAVGEALNALGQLKADRGDLESARESLERALAIKEEIYGSKDKELVELLIDLASIQRKIGNLVDAGATLERARSIAFQVYGPNDPTRAAVWFEFGELHQAKGDFERATRVKRHAVRIVEKAYEPDHVLVAEGLQSLASALRALGEEAEAATVLNRAAIILEARLGPHHFRTLSVRASLPSVAGAEELVSEIERYLRELESLQAKFVEVRGPKQTISYGTIRLDRRYGLRIDYDAPRNVTIVVRRDGILYTDRKLGQRNHLSSDTLPLSMLLNEQLDLRQAAVTEFQREGDELVVRLFSRDHPVWGTLQLSFRSEPLALRSWKLTDFDGLETSVVLTDVEMGGHFDRKSFALDYEAELTLP